jgi:hypothetical protein
MVLIAGANVGGLPPRSALAHITFRAEYAGNACGLLVPEAELVANTLGESLTTSVHFGRICVGDGVSPASPTPLATGALTPTPAATYPPFPSPTPGGTAGPTPAPGGGPPVFDPTVAAQASTSIPTPTHTPTPSTPTRSPTLSPTPTPTTLGAVVLPQTGGAGGETSVALIASAIGVAGLLAGVAIWLSLRRRPERP